MRATPHPKRVGDVAKSLVAKTSRPIPQHAGETTPKAWLPATSASGVSATGRGVSILSSVVHGKVLRYGGFRGLGPAASRPPPATRTPRLPTPGGTRKKRKGGNRSARPDGAPGRGRSTRHLHR